MSDKKFLKSNQLWFIIEIKLLTEENRLMMIPLKVVKNKLI
jgi:hypothetical protein